MLTVMGVQTMDALSGANTGTFTMPDPSRYFATLIVYAVLAGMAMFGEKPGKLAGALGGVAALAILLAPTKASVAAGTPKPLALSALTYLNQVITGGTQGTTSTFGGTTKPDSMKKITGYGPAITKPDSQPIG
jgi:hypothetical protein